MYDELLLSVRSFSMSAGSQATALIKVTVIALGKSTTNNSASLAVNVGAGGGKK